MNARRALVPLALLVARAALGAPSSLNTIPTADVVPFRQLTVQCANANVALDGWPTLFEQPQPALMAQAGLLANRVEGGIDLFAQDGARDYEPVANLKLVPLAEGDWWPAFAAGVANVQRGAAPTWYALATRTVNYASLQYQKFRAHHRNAKLHGFRVHAGAIGTRGDPRALLGSDLELSEHAVLSADWISGAGNAATLGAAWVIDARSSVQVALFAGNDERRVSGLQLQGTHTFGH